MEDIKRVFDELNGPSASKLLAALRAEGVQVKRAEVNSFVAKQVQAPRYDFDGKIAADGINDRWFWRPDRLHCGAHGRRQKGGAPPRRQI